MEINEEYGNRLYNVLKDLPVCIDTRRENGFITTRCPFCGDSKKSRTKGHLGIKVVIPKGDTSWYNCNRCKVSGLTDDYLLSLLNLYDDEVEFLRKANNTNISKNYGKLGLRDSRKNIIKILPPLNNAYTKAKLRYINNRLKINITQKDIDTFKLVLNLHDFLDYNRINIRTRHDRVIDIFDESYVGFLSTKNEFINFRIIDDNLINDYNKRYDNYNIFDIHENTRRFITIKNKIDIMQNVEIRTCEGPFDLMGIYKNVYHDCSDKNIIYVANMGMSSESVMTYLIKKGVIFNKLKIFADKGVTLDYYRDLKKKLDYRYKGTIEVFYNDFKNKKDFGVPKDEIKIKSFII